MSMMWLNRTACDALEGIRKCNETLNFSPVLSLVEELQVYFNRMEAALSDQKDIREMQETRRDRKTEIAALAREITALEEKKATLEK